MHDPLSVPCADLATLLLSVFHTAAAGIAAAFEHSGLSLRARHLKVSCFTFHSLYSSVSSSLSVVSDRRLYADQGARDKKTSSPPRSTPLWSAERFFFLFTLYRLFILANEAPVSSC